MTTLLQCALTTFILILETVDSVPTYQWADHVSGEQLTCQQCPPGSFVVRHCTRQTDTQCQPCQDLHYTQYWNYLERCRFCNVYCGELERVKTECNQTQNRVCECQPGYHRDSQLCVKHTKCGPGYGVSKEGTPDSDTECIKCPKGTFSAQNSMSQRCQPHQNCSDLGLRVNVPGTPSHNTVCTNCIFPFNSEKIDGECDKAVLDFVTHQKLYTRHLQRLRKILRRKYWNKKQSQLHFLLTCLRDSYPEQPFLPKLLEVLKKAKLHRLEQQLKQKFLQQEAS
ncbi:tumor necrosis factor receptor superfamily member 6B [Bombina bombina]|uniref:tumor necrosis factor receptor superfamily member 6B n=1 Tax=Bombina bombina TaxID=8345 RepID=UPI00235AA374|nr:tumor necrosis factor receptor superfamily member 6B [Bombina bombina]